MLPKNLDDLQKLTEDQDKEAKSETRKAMIFIVAGTVVICLGLWRQDVMANVMGAWLWILGIISLGNARLHYGMNLATHRTSWLILDQGSKLKESLQGILNVMSTMTDIQGTMAGVKKEDPDVQRGD